MNTARAFGPAVVSGFPNDSHWIVSRVFSALAISLFRGSISGSALSAKIELLGRQKEKASLDISLSARSEGQILTITQQIHVQYWLGPFLGALLSTAFYITLIQYVMGPRRAWEASYFCAVRGSGADAKETVVLFPSLGSTATSIGPSTLGKRRPSPNYRLQIPWPSYAPRIVVCTAATQCDVRRWHADRKMIDDPLTTSSRSWFGQPFSDRTLYLVNMRRAKAPTSRLNIICMYDVYISLAH